MKMTGLIWQSLLIEREAAEYRRLTSRVLQTGRYQEKNCLQQNLPSDQPLKTELPWEIC